LCKVCQRKKLDGEKKDLKKFSDFADGVAITALSGSLFWKML